jgi:hypothetical protein
MVHTTQSDVNSVPLVAELNKSFIFYVLLHLVFAAFAAIAFLFAAKSEAARAFPPFRPPSLPNATAAAFFSDFGLRVSPVACTTIEWASCAKSDLLDRLGMSI